MESINGYELSIIVVFLVGYAVICLEELVHFTKTPTALLMAIACWTLLFLSPNYDLAHSQKLLAESIGESSQIMLFLLGALAIVETISVHQGFNILTQRLRFGSIHSMYWFLGIIAFFLSSILDNMTTTIVMVSLCRKLIEDRHNRLIIGSAIVIAANAGGAWTPIGDITTTMLWIGGQISTESVMTALFLPSLVCLFAAMIPLHFQLRAVDLAPTTNEEQPPIAPGGRAIFFVGIGSFIMIPVFKALTGMPPPVGMLLGLTAVWLFTDVVHRKQLERGDLRLPSVLGRIDISCVLFFLGILLSVGALAASGILTNLATTLNHVVPGHGTLAFIIGLVSSVVDNVPLVAATMGMYDMTTYPSGSVLWHAIAYAAGTGGSILILGSAAGVAFMGLEGVSFLWYMRKITIPAALGYVAGFVTYLVMSPWTG